MAIEPVPYIDPAPVPGPQRGDESTFDDRMDAKILWDETSAQQFGDLADNVVHNAGEALISATEAGNQAIAAGNYATAAQDSAEASASSAADSNQSATNAQTSAEEAAQSAIDAAGTQVIATSATSLAIGNGTRVFTTQAGKQFAVGVPLIAVNPAAPANYMSGTVTSYSGTTLELNITSFGGTGTFANWNISIAGVQGPAGGTAGGNLTDSLNEKKGTDIASAATIDPWASGGNLVAMTGSATITGIAPAPQAGSRRTLLVKGSPTLVSGASMIIMSPATTLSLLPGDEIDIKAETTTLFLICVRKANGAATASTPAFDNCVRVTSSGPYVATKTGLHKIMLFGSHGRPGFALGSGAAGTSTLATGAGAPGVCIATVHLVEGQGYPLLLASPAASFASGTVGAYQGVAGNASTFSGSGIPTLTANGGGPGAAYFGSSPTTLLGGAGGTASGGDFNYPGGDGGDITAVGPAGYGATGGGNIAIKGKAYKAGNVSLAAAVDVSSRGASGGCGIGGKSGNVSLSGGTVVYSGGGGAGGASPDVNSGNGAGSANAEGVVAGDFATLPPVSLSFLNATAGGFGGNGSGAPRAGAGQAAGASTNCPLPGPLSGGAGTASNTGSLSVVFTTPAYPAGGPGGVAVAASSSTINFVGAPGACYILF